MTFRSSGVRTAGDASSADRNVPVRRVSGGDRARKLDACGRRHADLERVAVVSVEVSASWPNASGEDAPCPAARPTCGMDLSEATA